MSYEKIQVVVFDFRGVGRHLRSFLDIMPNVKRASDICPDDKGAMYLLPMRRNVVAQWFLEQTDLPWLLMVNDNVIPLPEIKELLDCKADVAGAHFFSRAGHEGHTADGSACTACMKVSRTALERIPRPWFKHEFNADHTERLMCDCGWFCKQAIAVGFHPLKVGLVAHVMEVAIAPPLTEKGECRFMFLHQIKPMGDAEGKTPSRQRGPQGPDQ